jgi:hypothetical protein
MTKQEQQKMRRLELENEQLRKINNYHIDVYRDMAIEMIELKTKLQLIEEAIHG